MPSAALHSGESHLIQQLADALRALPGIDIAPADVASIRERDPAYDARFDIHVAGQPLRLFVEARKSIYPRDVHHALWRLKAAAAQERSGTAVCVVAADSLSPGAKDLLRTAGVGYFDSGGSLYLPAPGAYVYIERPPPKAQTSAMRSLFSGRRSWAIHTLLLEREKWFSVNVLAAQSLVSPATASQVLTELERFGWVDVRGMGPAKQRHLSDPQALLDAWVTQVLAGRPPPQQRYFVPGLKGDALIARLAQTFEANGTAYAISHEAAAQRYAPYLSSIVQVRCRLLMSTRAEEALASLGAREVNEGTNLVAIEVKSNGDLLYRERIGNAWLASPIHVYLDLLKGEGRAKEMAEHLRKERIRC